MDIAVAACHTIAKSSGDVTVPFLAAYDDTYDAAAAINDTDNWILSLTSTQQPEALPQQEGLLGEAQTVTTDGNLSYRFTVSHYAVHPDHTATVQVEMCLDKGLASTRVSLSWAPWYVILADGTTATPAKQPSQSDLVVPLYPDGNNKPLTVGECISGLIMFDIPAGATNQAVEVDRKSPDLSWRVPQPGS
ncbi:hypothetical protein [Catenulispora pinisilvae]|uniref:hypothetical protein n=1 Tax=Catenulispora pinisilvae TaxID=2705253 RepID=UPI001892602C|nr:hypothetical protein [Catenulispora pinisilvae]